jgi:putative ABC transport system permease protein
MESVFQDLRYGLRMLRKNLAFTAVAVATLALGIGANTAMFSVIYAILLRPLPYPEEKRLVTLRSNQSLDEATDVRAWAQSFEAGGAVTTQLMDYTGSTEPLQINAGLVNAGLFQVLGANTELGRTLSAEEDVFGGPRVIVLSHKFWQQNLGADKSIIGKSIPISGNHYTVIGVMPAQFSLPERDADVFASLRVVYPEAAKYRGVHFMRSYWRLAPGFTREQAQEEMRAVDHRMQEQYPVEEKGRQSQVIPLRERLVGNTRGALLVLFGAVGLVLLVACSNFANLLLARGVTRQAEISIRTALGAGRARLMRQILTETVLLSLIGGIAGCFLAEAALGVLKALKPAQLERVSDIGISQPVMLFAFLLALLTGFVFGLVPAWSALHRKGDLPLDGGQRLTAGGARQRLRSVLVVGELALSLVLLAGAGLLLRGFWHLRNVDPGFDPANIVTMQLQLPESRYKDIPKQTQFRQQVLTGLNALPGMESAMVSEIPMGGNLLFHNFVIEGRPPVAPGDEPEIQSRSVMGDYFRTMRIPLLAGRNFTDQDQEHSIPVGILNAAAVKQFFPQQDPIGARIRWARADGPPLWFTIVGVVGDVKHFGLDQSEEPAIYNLYSQLVQQPWKRWMCLMIRTSADPVAVARAVKQEVWKIDGQIPVTKVQTMSEVMSAALAERHFNMVLLAVFAGMALVLAAVGVYGVVSYAVGQRTREIGIRMALGAEKRGILRLVFGWGMLLTLVGVFAGLVAAWAATRLMSGLLFGVQPTDPLTFAVVPLVLTAMAALAIYLPARRAANVDPMVALRYE